MDDETHDGRMYPEGLDANPQMREPQKLPEDGILRGKYLERTIPRHEYYMGKCPIELVPRQVWTTVPPKGEVTRQLPLTHVRFTDTDTEQCHSREECIKLLNDLQKEHMEKEGLSDIKYNFMIDSSGTMYEGRGWFADADRPDYEYGINLTQLKGKSLDIAYIGTFDGTMTVEVPWKMLACAFHFLAWGEKQDYMASYYSVTQLRIPEEVH